MSELEPLEIRKYGDPVLKREAERVTRVTAKTRRLLDRMVVTMYEAKGIGLAAPQVGVSQRIAVVDVGDGPIELINPEVVHHEGESTRMEGCLSIPNYLGEVTRPETIRVKAQNRKGRRFWLDADGLLARVIQHELDHLDGVLFPDIASRVVEIPPHQRYDVLFMATPEFGAEVLDALLEAGVPIRAVVTQPDRPAGRGQKLQSSPVKEVAEEHELRIFQPEDVSQEDFLSQVAELRPDLIITCAYGQILPGGLLDEARITAVNVHASLLPKYRGAAPIQWAIIEGEEETGITTFHMDEGMDTGPIILQRAISIQPGETAGQLHDRLAQLACEVLIDTLELIGEGEAPSEPQDDHAATYAPRITREDARMDWSLPARTLERLVRGLNPVPGAHTFFQGQRLKVWLAGVRPLPDTAEPPAPGTIIAVEHNDAGGAVVVACGADALELVEVQPAGSQAMAAADFANGYRLKLGQELGGGGDDLS